METWRDIKGYEGYYQVSNLGNIKTLDREVYDSKRHLFRFYKEKVMKTALCRKGYKRIQFKVGGVYKSYAVHRLVAEAFIPNPFNLPEVNHKDSNRENNAEHNLEWLTHSENQKHSYRQGKRNHKGENHPQAKLALASVLEIRERYSSGLFTMPFLASEYGVSAYAINNIVHYRTWKHV